MINSKSQSSKRCPKCQYDYNDTNDKTCQICNTPLPTFDELIVLQNTHSLNNKPEKLIRKKGHINKLSAKVLTRIKRIVSNLSNKKISNSELKELQKPINLIGLFFLGLAIFLWINYLFVQRSNEIKADAEKIKLEDANQVEVNPQGLFSYGGAPIFAPLVASGINGSIEKKYPGYELRYTKPLNGDFSSDNGIRMLIDGELSFAYNERPLTDEEYRIAKLRNINLKQIPIAIDGVVIYGNKQIKVEQLNREQLLRIFTGEIDNWREIDSQMEDLPIVPVVVQNENLKLLGIKKQQQLSPYTENTANYTQAIRKVIGTPGSISFASASIVQNQQLIKMFDLGDGGSSVHVSPLVKGNLNITDFKSGRYPLTRRIFIVLREDGTLDQQAGLTYANYLINQDGQKKIKEVGLVPIAKYEVESKS